MYIYYGYKTHSLLSVSIETSTNPDEEFLVVEVGRVWRRPNLSPQTLCHLEGGLRWQKSIPTKKILEVHDKIISRFKKENKGHVECIAAF